MLKNKIWLGIILSIILLVFSINGFTAYYKYTQESGVNFYVGIADKADALEDTNEIRQILDDLGNLLGHSKRDDLYPKDETTGGYLGRLNSGLDASKPAVPVVNDMYLATDTVKVYRCFVAGNWVEVYPGAVGATTFLELSDTPANYTGSSLKFARVNVGETALEFATEADPTVDTDAEIKAILVDEVIKTGDFTAGKIAKINNASGTIEQGTNTDTDVADAVTKKHSQNTDTDLDATFEATFVKKADTVNVLSDITSPGANIEDAVTKRHTQNTDTQFDFYNALSSDHTWSGDKDTQPVGEAVVFGDLLYPDWTAGEWLKADADLAAKMPGLRIALESKSDGQTCLMLVKGYIRDDSAFEFTASMVYTSVTPGAMSSTAPTETGDQLQRVGVAKSADILFFDPSIDVGEIKP